MGDEHGYVLAVAYLDDKGYRAAYGGSSQALMVWDFTASRRATTARTSAPIRTIRVLGERVVEIGRAHV